jgi:hypothetical protein
LDRALGLLLLAVYIVAIVGLAAGVTYAVIKIFPTKDRPDKPEKPEVSGDGAGSTAAGRLYRKAKRGLA